MNNLKYLYVRNIPKKRDVTIASDVYTEQGKQYVKCAWTFRCNGDKFIKKEGRKIALERLENMDEKYSAVIELDQLKFYEIVSRILGTILVKESTPKKFLQDISNDFCYFTECAVNGKPNWEKFIEREINKGY